MSITRFQIEAKRQDDGPEPVRERGLVFGGPEPEWFDVSLTLLDPDEGGELLVSEGRVLGCETDIRARAAEWGVERMRELATALAGCVADPADVRVDGEGS